ncbi:uncharacterized protein LOC127074188 isoform X3 [Lathyrus oleraceus]|uniref:uncharacterized protein LOC127074188 isoform X3 n=1 Tax=Pisum sativum TaxID=3888 RepID=UPI0021D07010|nr:uncharacterized protein LOC127074188 isoform X3 [Pisum sativum]
MDYDDNDFQSQNLHLAGEGSTKFPPVLRPYALPKFDYDESLQGHLRFDSLVDTEVFLGIESNEDNQWIDAYSRVSSGIEFNSTEAETCSISRHNNVWSEATSSESVEMLLKSVGQEEFIPREAVIQESDACDELACLVNQMDPCLKADEKIEFKDNVADTQSPSCIHEDLSVSKEDVEMEQSLAGVSQGCEGEPSIDGSLNNIEPPDMHRHIDLPESGGILFTDGKYDDTIQMKVETPADASLHEKTNDNSSASVATANMTEASTVNIPSTCEVLKIQNMQNQIVGIGDDNQSSLQTQTSKQDFESYVKNKNSDVDTQTLDVSAVEGEANQSDNPLYLIHREDTLEGESVVEGLATGISTSEKSLNTVSNDISNLQKTERESEDACFRDLSQRTANIDTLLIKDPVADDQSAPNTSNIPKIAIKDDSSSEGEDAYFRDLSQENANKDAFLIKGPLTDDQSAPSTSDTPKIAIEDDSSYEGHKVEASNSDCGTCPNYQPNMVTIEKTLGVSNISKEKELLFIANQMDTDDLLSKADASMFAVVDKKTFVVGEGNSDNRASFFSFNTVVSTKPCILGETTQVCENNKSNKQGEHKFFCQDISVSDQGSEKASFDSSTIHCDVDQSHLANGGACSSSLGACSMEASTVSVDVTPINSSVTDHHELKRMKHVGSASVDEKEDVKAQIVEEADISLPVGFSKLEVEPCPAAGNVNKKNSDNTEHILCETDNSCLHNLDICATESIGEPQEIQSGMADHECTKEATVVADLGESNEKQGDEVTVSFIKDDKEAIQEHHDKPYSKLSGSISSSVPDPHNELHETGGCPANPSYNKCGPSATFGSPLETEKGVSIKPTANLNTPVFEFVNKEARNTSSSDHDHMGNDVSKDGRSLDPDVDLVANSSKKDITDLTPIGEKAGERGPLETEKGVNIKPIANLNTPVFEFMNKDARNTSSSDHDHKGNDVSKDGKSVAPDVGLVANSSKKDVTDMTPIGAKAGVRGSFPVIAANKESVVVAESPPASDLGTPKPNVARLVSHGSPQIPDGDLAQSVSKGTPEHKTRRTPNKTAGKESSRKGSKGKTPAKRSEKGDSSTSVPLSPSSGFQLMQSNEAHQYRKIDSISTKPFSDLNPSASPSVMFQQPFMDVQQVQLRAQIFVYGALIQGIVPEEAYMLSAFGGADGGRNFWEKAWSSCLERQRIHKSHPINPETPLQSLSGTRTHDLAVKQSEPQGKGITSPLGLASSKGTPTIVNPFIPLSSPLWSLPSPSQTLVSLHPNQTPPLRNFLGHNTSRISQSPLRGPWIASSTPALDNNSYLSASPVTDTIKSSSIKGTSAPSSSSIKNVPPNLQASNVGLQNVFLQTTPLFNTNNVTVSAARHSCDPKSKKRKKVTTESEDLGHKAIHMQSHLVSTPVVSNHISPANATATPVVNVPVTTVEKSVESVSPLSLPDRLKSGWNVEKRIMSDESLTKIEEARINAEEASALSAAAVNHSMEIWKQLDKQKNSGLASDIEAKLASAAVAAAAAAAVAKAAAAAASVASNAALQAKLMADEALIFSGLESSCGTYFSEGMNNLGKATPASILKGASGINSSSSIIGAAKEASRRRVEAASFARKRAENVDAIVKAAELAAEAVSQAGRIVTMGDPLPLSHLVEAGPEGYWKTLQESSQQVGLLKGMSRGPMNVDNLDRPETSQISNRDTSSMEMGKHIAASEESPFQKGCNEMSLDPIRSVDENSSNGSRARRVSNLVNPVGVLPESVTEMQASLTDGNGPGNLEESNIKEGSHVEVFKDGKGFKAAWFTANLLSLKDGKAYVCYNRLVADEGPLKEWVSLEDDGDKPPRIRAAHSVTSFHNEGTRKRQRAAMVDYWSIGDKVDAWIQESWQEGIITERSKKDRTYTVQFPASGETSVVEAWYLRPSLIWNDGKWVESPNVGAIDSPTNEGDTPSEKRTKLGSLEQELVKGKNKTSKGTFASESANPSELRLLNLSEDHKVFNAGKNIKNEKNPDAHRLARSGLQKEGPKVIFGVPKQGRKKKFMEVSKHYVAEGTSRINDGNDSDKIADSLIPHASGSRGWKNSSIKGTKEKLGADCKPISKSGKPHSVMGRVIPSKQKPLSNPRNNDCTSRTERTRDSSSHANSASQRENQMERASYSETPGARQTSNSSRASSTDSHPTKKPLTSRASKGKQAHADGRWGKVEVEKAVKGNLVKSTSEEVLEPRRSNRKIQPTSRLLEGIQSSLIITKTSSGPHEKGHKNQNRNTPRG